MPEWYDDIADALAECGLLARGAFHPGPGDDAPDGAATIVLVGNAGPAMWQAFHPARGESEHALDEWSAAVLDSIAGRFGGIALYPFGGPPWLPFQRWAMRAEPVAPSPLGILIHPDFGLWHGYRGALAFAERRVLPEADERRPPCETCADRPCLASCPVDAFSSDGYDVPACAGHLRDPAGADCMALGCRARRACPIGRSYTYIPAQAAFHMDAFLRARS